jgi:hypothetical protein
MFTWFRRDAEYLGYEAREIGDGAYELVVRQADGTERVEAFSDQHALTDRQVSLQHELEALEDVRVLAQRNGLFVRRTDRLVTNCVATERRAMRGCTDPSA